MHSNCVLVFGVFYADKPPPKPILKPQPQPRPKDSKPCAPVESQAAVSAENVKKSDRSAESAPASDQMGKATLSAESLKKTVPEVVGAIEQISNFFGSSSSSSGQHDLSKGHPKDTPKRPKGTSELSSKEAEVVGQSAAQQESTAIGKLSRESIGRLADQIAEQLAAQDPGGDSSNPGDIPSYAPEKCIAGYGGEGDGKVSPDRLPQLSTKQKEEEGVNKLKGLLVSEKEIFGEELPEHSDSDEEAACDMADDMAEPDLGDPGDPSDLADTAMQGGGEEGLAEEEVETGGGRGAEGAVSEGGARASSGEGARGAVGVGSGGEGGGKAPSEAEMKAEFQKLTSLSGQLKDSTAYSEYQEYFWYCLSYLVNRDGKDEEKTYGRQNI